MWGQPEPTHPRPSSEPSLSEKSHLFRRGVVSLWTGTFSSIEEAEAYFGIPDEIGVYLPAAAFAEDVGLGDFSPEALEANFEQTDPRPLTELLHDATFAGSFLDQATAEANRQGIHEAQGIALLYDCDYRRLETRDQAKGPTRFVGAFPYVEIRFNLNLQPWQQVSQELGYSMAAVFFVTVAFEQLLQQRRKEAVGEVHLTASDVCDEVLKRGESDSGAILRELGLTRSEDVGRIIWAMFSAGMIKARDSESEADFAGLYDLDAV